MTDDRQNSIGTGKTKAMVVALDEHWVGASRLPFGLSRVGFSVSVVCPLNSYIAKTRYVDQAIKFPTWTYSRSKIIYLIILWSFIKFKPEVVVHGDEDALLALQTIRRFTSKLPGLRWIAKTISNSICDEKFDFLTLSKADFVQKCSEWGVLTPKNIKVQTWEDVLVAAKQVGYPLVLKRDMGYGGSGVTICQDERQLQESFQKLEKISVLARVKGIVRKIFFVSIFSGEDVVSVQQFVSGTVGLIPFVSKNGKLISANPMLKFKTHPGQTGPTSVGQGYFDPTLLEAVQVVSGKMNYTGFGSLDFIVDEKTKKAFIIELNPRATPVVHLTKEQVGHDLCDAFYKSQQDIAKRPVELLFNEANLKPYLIALFPNEQRRDPNSPYIKGSDYDIPVDDPELIKVLLGK